VRALGAIAACWQLCMNSDGDGEQGALAAIRALLPALQPQCRDFARELIAFAGDWSHRRKYWPLVSGEMVITPDEAGWISDAVIGHYVRTAQAKASRPMRVDLALVTMGESSRRVDLAELRELAQSYNRDTDCRVCGRGWYPSINQSRDYPGSACVRGECKCVTCDAGGFGAVETDCSYHEAVRASDRLREILRDVGNI